MLNYALRLKVCILGMVAPFCVASLARFLVDYEAC